VPLGRVAEIWRHPVSGLQGERLTRGEVVRTSIAGDHAYVLRGKEWDKILDPITHSSSLGETAGLYNTLGFAAATLSGDPAGEHT
jgi:hypothetical protein